MNYTYRYGLVFWKEQIPKYDFDFFRKNIVSAEADVMIYIRCNSK